MPRTATRLGDDAELGKKDDDHRPREGDDLILSDVLPARLPGWKRNPRRLRRQVVTLLVLISFVGIILYITVGGQNSIDAQAQRRPRSKPPVPSPKSFDPETQDDAPLKKPTIPKPAPKKSKLLRGRPPVPQHHNGGELQYFDGPLEWPTLADTLRVSSTGRVRNGGQNVLFAAASLQSLARLAPIACEMARWNRNTVHMAIMGRYALKMEKIKQINGVDSSCEAFWHDARPEYAAYSTNKRFKLGIYTAFEHINSNLMPEAIIIDERGEEETEFLMALDKFTVKRASPSMPVISLPADAVHSLQWITRLDAGSLAAWNKAKVEILVRAQVGNSKSLMRLLDSIQRADYFGSSPPHLTIELPADLDRHTKEFLDGFAWPPPTEDGRPQVSLLTFRKRLPRASVDADEASMRLIESFYPSRSSDSHVLLLSPEVELSPQYYHYLMYNLLEYRYSIFNRWSREVQELAGISLITPSQQLDGKTELVRPKIPVEGKKGKGKSAEEEITRASPFLWQAPDTHATLYFGDKWKQMHSFFYLRMGRPFPNGGKEVTTRLPAFAEYFLELMLARGWFVLYPHLPGFQFATAHNEVYQPPEEYRPSEPVKDINAPKPHDKDPLSHPGPGSLPSQKQKQLPSTPLHILLPDDGDLMEIERLPMLSYKGLRLTSASKGRLSSTYTQLFRDTTGNCATSQPIRAREDDSSADDLFCEVGPEGQQQGPPPLKEEEMTLVNDKGESNGPVAAADFKVMKNELAHHLDRQKDRSG